MTSCAPSMNNYMMYTGDQSVYTFTFELEKKEECGVCGSAQIAIEVEKSTSLQDLIDLLLERRDV